MHDVKETPATLQQAKNFKYIDRWRKYRMQNCKSLRSVSFCPFRCFFVLCRQIDVWYKREERQIERGRHAKPNASSNTIRGVPGQQHNSQPANQIHNERWLFYLEKKAVFLMILRSSLRVDEKAQQIVYRFSFELIWIVELQMCCSWSCVFFYSSNNKSSKFRFKQRSQIKKKTQTNHMFRSE